MRTIAVNGANFSRPLIKINNKNNPCFNVNKTSETNNNNTAFCGIGILGLLKPQKDDFKDRIDAAKRAQCAYREAKGAAIHAAGVIELDICSGFSGIKGEKKDHGYCNNDPEGRKFLILAYRKRTRIADFDPTDLIIYSIEDVYDKSGKTDKYIIEPGDEPTKVLINCKKNRQDKVTSADEVFVFDDGKVKEYYKKATFDETGEILKYKKHYVY